MREDGVANLQHRRIGCQTHGHLTAGKEQIASSEDTHVRLRIDTVRHLGKRLDVFLANLGDLLLALVRGVTRAFAVRPLGGVSEIAEHVHDLVVAVGDDDVAARRLGFLGERAELSHDGEFVVAAIEDVADLHKNGRAAAPLAVLAHHLRHLKRAHGLLEVTVEVADGDEAAAVEVHFGHGVGRVDGGSRRSLGLGGLLRERSLRGEERGGGRRAAGERATRHVSALRSRRRGADAATATVTSERARASRTERARSHRETYRGHRQGGTRGPPRGKEEAITCA